MQQAMGIKEAIAQYKDAREKYHLMTGQLDELVHEAAETYVAIYSRHYRHTLSVPKHRAWYIDKHNIVTVEWAEWDRCGERHEEGVEFDTALLYDSEEAARIDARFAADVRAKAGAQKKRKALRDHQAYEKLKAQFEGDKP